MLQEHNPGGIWIGAKRTEEDNNWMWTDCSPWNFTKWGARQPDNSSNQDGAGENCALVIGNKSRHIGWDDVPCNFKEREFVCRKPMCSGKAY